MKRIQIGSFICVGTLYVLFIITTFTEHLNEDALTATYAITILIIISLDGFVLFTGGRLIYVRTRFEGVEFSEHTTRTRSKGKNATDTTDSAANIDTNSYDYPSDSDTESENTTKEKAPKKVRVANQAFKLAFFVIIACLIGFAIIVVFVLSSFTDDFENTIIDVWTQKSFEPTMLLMPMLFYLSGPQTRRVYSKMKCCK